MCQRCKDVLDRWSLFFNKCIQAQKTLQSIQKSNRAPVYKKNTKKYCCARYCQNTNLDEKLFCLPKINIERAKQWLLNADRADLLEGVDFNVDFIKRKNLAICRQHFESKMFFNDLRETLVSTAVPTLFKADLGIKKAKKNTAPVSSNLRKIYPKPSTELKPVHFTNHDKENKTSNLLLHSDSGEVYSVLFLTEDSQLQLKAEESHSNNEISSHSEAMKESQLVTIEDSNVNNMCTSSLDVPLDDNTGTSQVVLPHVDYGTSQVVPTENDHTCTSNDVELDSQILPDDHSNINQTKQSSAIKLNDSSLINFLDSLDTYEVAINQQPLDKPMVNSSSLVCDILESDPSKVIGSTHCTSLSERCCENSVFENNSSINKAVNTSNLSQESVLNPSSTSASSIQPLMPFEKLNETYYYMQSVTDVDPLSTIMVPENIKLEEADCLIETSSEDLIEMPSNLVETSSNIIGTHAYLIETPSNLLEMCGDDIESPSKFVETPLSLDETHLIESSSNVVQRPSDLAETPSYLIETPSKLREIPSEPTLSDSKRSIGLVDEDVTCYSFLDYDTSRLLNAQQSSGMMIYSCEFCGDTLLTEGLLQNHCKLYHSM
ncbi:hypothetical protein WDU94_012760 [Cyamophila willieti]